VQRFAKTLSSILAVTFALASPASVSPIASAASNDCGLTSPAFCETFDAPNPQVDRAGQLEHVVWGVSRATSDTNNGQQILNKWSSSQLQACGTTQLVAPENDAVICNGRMAESINDNENSNLWAAYPRQPFDIAGRTGKVTFDVGNDTQGPHAAWPAFVYTDQPVPAPYGGVSLPGISNYARNSIGFSLAEGGCVDVIFMSTNYVSTTPTFTKDACVIEPASAAQIAAGQLNHYEVDLNSSSMTVFGTDPGGSTLKQIAHVSGISVPLSRGLVWIEDVHYNGDKFNGQRNHTFVWDNVGFDGPILTRDLGFDVLDSRVSKGPGVDGYPTMNLGYMVQGSDPGLTVQTVPGMTSAQIGAATGALLEFTWFPYNRQTLTYSLNGHTSHSVAWPYPGEYTFSSQTLAVPIALSELQAGVNSIHLQSSDAQVVVANFDIILVAGAAGGSSGELETMPTATSTSAPTNTPTAPPPTATPDTSGGGATPGGGGATTGGGGGGGGSGGGGGGGGGGNAPVGNSQNAPTATATVPQAATGSHSITIAPTGGELVLADLGLTIQVPPEAVASANPRLDVQPMTAGSVPPASGGLQAGDRSFQIGLSDTVSGQVFDQVGAPLSITYQPTAAELARADQKIAQVGLMYWTGDTWAPLPCSPTVDHLACFATQLGMFASASAPSDKVAQDFDIPDGHFFKQSNGFNGGGQLGYAVTDGADGAFWTAFQSIGGVERAGYPITNRFIYRGFVVQAFQKVALQWQPDLGQAVPINILDDFSPTTNAWLSTQRNIPTPPPTSDQGQPTDDVVAAHVALLDAFPDLKAFYSAQSDAMTLYGLPVAVQDYGTVATARLERGVLRVWAQDMPGVAAGTPVVDNVGDLAKQTGLWPLQAAVPSPPPLAGSHDAG
jgi:hypothetical protein